mmetsp:Transcript_95313/g.253181  ORF Transcript_95313/g.253181 Transcript_95313/m.253181 type:complete len:218 (-) Transcript_95313:10-663(-)
MQLLQKHALPFVATLVNTGHVSVPAVRGCQIAFNASNPRHATTGPFPGVSRRGPASPLSPLVADDIWAALAAAATVPQPALELVVTEVAKNTEAPLEGRGALLHELLRIQAPERTQGRSRQRRLVPPRRRPPRRRRRHPSATPGQPLLPFRRGPAAAGSAARPRPSRQRCLARGCPAQTCAGHCDPPLVAQSAPGATAKRRLGTPEVPSKAAARRGP